MTSLEENVFNVDSLIESYERIKKNIRFKYSVQRYGINLLSEVTKTIDDYKNNKFTFSKGKEFTISERGKTRHITPVPFNERVVLDAFCNNILLPKLKKYLIYDNCASLKGKGIDMQKDRFEYHLKKYWYSNGKSNDGCCLLFDFSSFFDNILHEKLKKSLKGKLLDEEIDFLSDAIKIYGIDGTMFTDLEYEKIKNGVYDSKQYYNRRKKLSNNPIIYKSVGIGSPISQVVGVFYPTPIDNYVKIVKGCKFYGRYNDDGYAFGNKEFLQELLIGIRQIANELGIYINEKKTRIVNIKDGIKFLKTKFVISETGHVTRYYDSERFIREERKLKKYKEMLHSGLIDYKTIENQYKSWRGNIIRKRKNGNYYYCVKDSLKRTDDLYNTLFIIPFIKGGIYAYS